jgi:hypothetical protein
MSSTPISFVHEVPDPCDRIVWRKKYYSLPIADLAAAQQEIAGLRAALESALNETTEGNVAAVLEDALK